MSELAPPYGVIIPPGADELPYDDGVPLESNRHRVVMSMLADGAERHLAGLRPDYCVGANMFFYFSILQTKKNDFRGPDVFVALGVPHRDRKSWVVWEEDGKVPDLIIELTSESTAEEDHGTKKRLYARLRVPEYFIFDPGTAAFEGFHLDVDLGGGEYRPMTPMEHGRLPSRTLGLELGIWNGIHRGYPGPWLRWYFPTGKLVPLPEEAEVEERRLREEERRLRQEAEQKLAAAMAELARWKGEPPPA